MPFQIVELYWAVLKGILVRKIKFIFSDKHQQHAPKNIAIRGNLVPNLEKPERAQQLHKALIQAGHTMVPTSQWSRKWLAEIHTTDYLTFLETAYVRWQSFIQSTVGVAGDSEHKEIFSHVFPHHSARALPSSIQGQVGYYLSGGSCPVDEGTWCAALNSANTALTAANLIVDGAPEAYAVCRPPGHHAYADMAGGFCYLNNVAIAANYLTKHFSRIAVLDIDAHHGNGTQSIFYGRDDVYFASIHGDPNVLFPFYAGYAHERGEGAGLGYNLNLPLPIGTEDHEFIEALVYALGCIENYAPDVLVISLGFDPFKGDPSACLSVSTEGFKKIGQLIGEFRGPVLLVQEGGYVVDDLSNNLNAFLNYFLKARE